MASYFCKMAEYDAPEDWSPVSAFGPKAAALQYAEHCDGRSGGELFDKPTSVQTVVVREATTGAESRFDVEVEFVKEFHARAAVQQSTKTEG